MPSPISDPAALRRGKPPPNTCTLHSPCNTFPSPLPATSSSSLSFPSLNPPSSPPFRCPSRLPLALLPFLLPLAPTPQINGYKLGQYAVRFTTQWKAFLLSHAPLLLPLPSSNPSSSPSPLLLSSPLFPLSTYLMLSSTVTRCSAAFSLICSRAKS